MQHGMLVRSMVKDVTKGLINCKLRCQEGHEVPKMVNEQSHDLLVELIRVGCYARVEKAVELEFGLGRYRVAMQGKRKRGREKQAW